MGTFCVLWGTFKVLRGFKKKSLGDNLGPSIKLQVKCVNMSLVKDSRAGNWFVSRKTIN